MISVTGKTWVQKKIEKNSIEKLKQDHNFSEILSKLIITRKFDQTEIYSIENHLDLTNDFVKINDFTDSINLLSLAINNKEKGPNRGGSHIGPIKETHISEITENARGKCPSQLSIPAYMRMLRAGPFTRAILATLTHLSTNLLGEGGGCISQ